MDEGPIPDTDPCRHVLDCCIRCGPQRVDHWPAGLFYGQTAGLLCVVKIDDEWFAVHTRLGFDAWRASARLAALAATGPEVV